MTRAKRTRRSCRSEQPSVITKNNKNTATRMLVAGGATNFEKRGRARARSRHDTDDTGSENSQVLAVATRTCRPRGAHVEGRRARALATPPVDQPSQPASQPASSANSFSIASTISTCCCPLFFPSSNFPKVRCYCYLFIFLPPPPGLPAFVRLVRHMFEDSLNKQSIDSPPHADGW